MDFTFGPTELATLHDLQTMAQKHGGFIKIDMYTHDCVEFDKEEIQKEIELPLDKLYIYDAQYSVNTCCFCLVVRDRDDDLCALGLREFNVDFGYSRCKTLTQEENEELENEGFEEDGHYYDTILKTKVKGFTTIPETVKATNVYRYGIALREFSNLVCDYLGEPRIDRVY